MHIQPLTLNDLPVLAELQPADWSDIVANYREYASLPFCFPVKVCLDNKIAGIGAVIIHNNIAWLGHIIVHHNQTNKGIGGFLTRQLVTLAEAKGCETVLLIATDLGAPVYEKAGFVTEAEYLFYKDLQAEINLKPVDNITPYTGSFFGHVAEIDFRISGEKRMPHLSQFLVGGFVFQKNEIVEGFYLPGFGDGVILATTAEAGTELMKFRLQTKNSASFPSCNVAAANLLKSLGYAPYKAAKRMRLGKPVSWQPENIYNRIGGNLG